MAKGNMFLGMSRGSVGDVTFYRNRGNQVARARNRKPANPRSEAQVIQRMLLATASRAYSRMKGIVDHSFQGVQYGGISQSYFLKRALEDLRTWVALTLPSAPESVNQNPTGVYGLAYPTRTALSGVGLLISEGTVPSVPAVTVTPAGEGSVPSFDHFGAIITDETAAIPAFLNAIGAKWGDQITVVALNYRGEFLASRYVMESNPSEDDLEDVWDGTISSALFDRTKSLLSRVRLIVQGEAGARKIVPIIEGDTGLPDAAAVIISRKVGDVWQRSTQRLVWLSEAVDLGDFPENVLPEWLAGSAVIDTVNPRYLNQAEQGF